MDDYFTMRGFQVDCVQQLREAYGLLDLHSYEGAILDLRLGGSNNLDGLTLLRSVKERTPSTRCIALTACDSAEVEAEALKSGADVFLHKPQPLSELAEVMSRLLSKQRSG
ncbi:MAG: two-component system, response regulator RegA [Acidobacteriota bacterium]|nr:two-component system, response regulator RegA [Acidobacteriota bacterium]MDT7779118.1 two-component system, response regulator RegA [Acidobacteriota bacterium]